MPPRDWKLRIEDILDSIEKIARYTDGMALESFMKNDLVIDAVIRNLAVIGEAAGHVPNEICERYTALPWNEMRGMRNVLVHEYFGANLKTIWDTVRYDLPPIVKPLTDLLASRA